MTVDSSKGESALSSFTRRMQSAGGDVSARFAAVGQSITGVGNNIAGVGGQLTKSVTAPAAGAALAVGGITAALGWGRLKSLDTAKAQMRGLGYSTEDVNRITGQLSDDLANGMMTMAEGTFAAANGMAAGVKEGQELTKYIQLMDSAVVAGTGSFDEMNKIFGQTADLGHLTASNFDMMSERLPAFSANAQEHFGVGADALRDMLNDGEVSMDDFLAIIDEGYGGMAEEMAGTWEGMASNVKNWVGIIGETLLGGVFAQSKDSIEEFIGWLTSDEVQAWAAETSTIVSAAFEKVLNAVRSVIEWWGNLDSSTQKVIMTIGGIVLAAGPVLMIVGKVIAVVGGLITTFSTIIGVLAKVGPIVNGVITVLRALWMVMLANPIILIIAAVAAVVAALVWFFTQTETGKEMWSNFMDWLAGAWEWIKETAVAVFDGIVDAIVGAWEWVRDKTAEIWDTVVGWIQDNWDSILDILSLANPVTAVIRHWDTIKNATSTAWNWVVNLLAGIWNKITTTISNAVNNVVTWITNAWNNAKTRTSNAFNSIRTAVSNGINGAVTFVAGLPGRVLSVLGNIGNTLYNSGRNLIDGFRRGIVNAFNNAVNAVKNGMSRIRNFFPFSPAKEGPFSGSGWTFNSGEAITQGLADGMNSRIPSIVKEAEAITRAAAAFDPPVIPGMSGPGARGGQQADGSAAVQNITFVTNNPIAEPTSETARKASAYIGV